MVRASEQVQASLPVQSSHWRIDWVRLCRSYALAHTHQAQLHLVPPLPGAAAAALGSYRVGIVLAPVGKLCAIRDGREALSK